MTIKHRFFAACATAVLGCNFVTAQSLDSFQNGLSPKDTLIITVPAEMPNIIEDIKSAIQVIKDKSCAGAEHLGCVDDNPWEDIIRIVNTPKNCQLLPCLAGCPGANDFKCLPSRAKIHETMMRSPDANNVITDSSNFPAQGGGHVHVITYGDGSHEAYYDMQGTGLYLIEAGGGGGGHAEILDDIKTQWAAR